MRVREWWERLWDPGENNFFAALFDFALKLLLLWIPAFGMLGLMAALEAAPHNPSRYFGGAWWAPLRWGFAGLGWHFAALAALAGLAMLSFAWEELAERRRRFDSRTPAFPTPGEFLKKHIDFERWCG